MCKCFALAYWRRNWGIGGLRLPRFGRWKYLHSMQRFGGGFGKFAILANLSKSRQNLCMGWGFLGFLAFLSKWAKTRCVSDLTKSSFVRHAASFGSFDKK